MDILPPLPAKAILVGGVSGCGKNTVGEVVAKLWNARFEDADMYHSPANKEKMRNEIPLTDADRESWLAGLEALVRNAVEKNEPLVLAVSGLRRAYRDRLRAADPRSVRMVWLNLSYEVAFARVSARVNHFFPPRLVASQFKTVEPLTHDEWPIILDGTASPVRNAHRVLAMATDGVCAWSPKEQPRLYRTIVPVSDIQLAAEFYATVIGHAGERVSPGRHYFMCGACILACYDAVADGDAPASSTANREPRREILYLSVGDVATAFAVATRWPGVRMDAAVTVQPWGEESGYFTDPFGNAVCLVQLGTEFVGTERPRW